MRNVCEKNYFRPIGLFCSFCSTDSACSRFPATTTNCFHQSSSSHTLCSYLEFLSTTTNICNFWHSQFQQVSTHAFCNRDEKFTQKGNCCSPSHICKRTESQPTVSTNTSIEKIIYLSWSNLLVTSFRLEMNVGRFPKHRKETSDTGRYKWYFFTACVSQDNVSSLNKNFEQWSESQVAKCLVDHVISSGYNVPGFYLWNKRKTI